MSLTEKRKIELEELADSTRQRLTVYDVFPVPMRTVWQRIHDVEITPRISTRIERDEQMLLDQAFTVVDTTKREIVLSSTTEKDIGITSRANFTLAHELGHALLHTSDKILSRSKSHRDYRSKAGVLNVKWKENEANYFAAAFLMPLKAIAPQQNKEEISQIFKVSIKTAEIRLEELEKQRMPKLERRLSENTLRSMERLGIDTSKYRK